MAATHKRQEILVSHLARHGYASLADLVAELNVSVSTVRRDLDELQRMGTVRRTRGGAVYLGAREHPLDYGQRAAQNAAEKEWIGDLAADFIRDGDAVILDGGTTTYQVARRLRGRSVQVVTNSLPIASLLSNSLETELIFLGGSMMPQTGVIVGSYAKDILHSLHVRLAIMGMAGIVEDGLYNAHILLVELQRLMIKSAEEVVVVADHTKFGRRSLARVCGFDEVSRLISDSSLDPHWRQVLRQYPSELLLASGPSFSGARREE